MISFITPPKDSKLDIHFKRYPLLLFRNHSYGLFLVAYVAFYDLSYVTSRSSRSYLLCDPWTKTVLLLVPRSLVRRAKHLICSLTQLQKSFLYLTRILEPEPTSVVTIHTPILPHVGSYSEPCTTHLSPYHLKTLIAFLRMRLVLFALSLKTWVAFIDSLPGASEIIEMQNRTRMRYGMREQLSPGSMNVNAFIFQGLDDTIPSSFQRIFRIRPRARARPRRAEEGKEEIALAKPCVRYSQLP